MAKNNKLGKGAFVLTAVSFLKEARHERPWHRMVFSQWSGQSKNGSLDASGFGFSLPANALRMPPTIYLPAELNCRKINSHLSLERVSLRQRSNALA